MGTLALGLLCLAAPALEAQSDDRDPSIANLPRPGYEPRTLRYGNVVIEPSIEAETTYDSNILATRTDKIGDAIFNLRPRITADRKGPTLDLQADVHADIIRYASHPRENVNTFGATLAGTKTIGDAQTVIANLAFDRTFERRSDPEADIDRTRPPALINIATGDLQYRYHGARIGITADAAVTKLDYLPVADADRDMLTYRASVRGSFDLSRRIAVYVEPFVNRRDFRLPPSRTGIFGDTTTVGGLLGVSFDLGDTLQGNMGAGIFSAKPDGTSSFTGLAINGRLIWRPRVRTSVIFSAFRGDAATVRAGSLGRIDTRIGLAIDQEVRHNLLLHVAGGVRAIHYRGGVDNDQTYVTGEAEARYLLNRHVSLVADTSYTHRSAKVPDERFNRLQAMLGVRLIY